MDTQKPHVPHNEQSKNHTDHKQSHTTTQTKTGVRSNNFSKQAKFIAVPIIILVILVALLGIATFAGSEQSYLSRLFDSINQPKISVGLDSLRNPESRSVVTSTLLNDGSRYDICAGELPDLNTEPVWAASGIIAQDVRPLTATYATNTFVSGAFEYNLNLREEKAFARLSVNGSADLKEAKKLSAEEYATKKAEYDASQLERQKQLEARRLATKQPASSKTSYDYDYDYDYEPEPTDMLASAPDTLTVNAAGKAVATINAGYLYLEDLSIETDSFQSKNNLTKWYSQDWEINDTQKEGMSELLDVAEDVLTIDPKTIVSSETAAEWVAFACDSSAPTQDVVTILNYGDHTAQIGNETITIRGRKVVIDGGEVNIADLDESNPEVEEKLSNLSKKTLEDATFKEFLYSQYDRYVAFTKASQKLETYDTEESEEVDMPEQESEIMSEEDYRKDVDEFIADGLKSIEENKQSTDENQDTSMSDNSTDTEEQENPWDDVTIDTQPSELYLNSDMEIIAVRTSTRIIFGDKALEQMPSYLRPYLKDGIATSALIYQIAFNDDVEAIVVPNSNEVKPIDSLEEDLDVEEIYDSVLTN